jgi:antitoxin MazE
MEITVRKWGNSLAVRIPKVYADEIKIYQGSKMTIKREATKLIMEPSRKGEALKALLARITAENIHEEIETGERVGNEAWIGGKERRNILPP